MDMRAFDVFKEEGSWLRGNLHSHTTNSDGDATPQELVDWYENHGYDFLAITDHDVITDVDKLRSKDLLLIPGIEFYYEPEEVKEWFGLDMLGINIKELPDFLDPEKTGHVVYDTKMSPQQIIDHLNEIGGMAIMCHPYFMRNLISPYLRYHSYVGVEAYNFVCDEMGGCGHQEIYWDVLLARKRRLLGFATDDSHWADFGHAWIEVKSKEKTIPAILDAIREGKFYSTTGIKILDVTYTEDRVSVSFDRPCDVIFVQDRDRMVRAYNNTQELVNGSRVFRAEAKLRGYNPFMRIELRDAVGNVAYTNPVYLD